MPSFDRFSAEQIDAAQGDRQHGEHDDRHDVDRLDEIVAWHWLTLVLGGRFNYAGVECFHGSGAFDVKQRVHLTGAEAPGVLRQHAVSGAEGVVGGEIKEWVRVDHGHYDTIVKARKAKIEAKKKGS